MQGVLVIVSVLGLYVEVVLQLCVLIPTTDNDSSLHPPLAIIVTILIAVSFIVTNLASLILAFGEWEGKLCRGEKSVCVVFHICQLGLLWRAYRVVSRYQSKDLFHLILLRLIHPSLVSFLYVIAECRLMFFLGHQMAPLPVVSLVVSLTSSTVALCCYVLRHKLRETATTVIPTVKPQNSLRFAGTVLLFCGTFLCLASRLGSFALLSVHHGFWALLPFCAHFFIYAAVHFSCSTLHDGDDGSAKSGLSEKGAVLQNSPTVFQGEPDNACIRDTVVPCSSANNSDCSHNASSMFSHPNIYERDTNHSYHHEPRNASVPITNNSEANNSFQNQVSHNTYASETATDSKASTMVVFLSQGLAKTYLNTWDLVDNDLQRVQCRYVLFYSLVLVENLAMTAVWMLNSSHSYTTKLAVVVGVLAAFSTSLVLKFASCGCFGGGCCASTPTGWLRF
ncbi:uncharacterized protein [Littorina saxatilis]|uniref:uncharacterized protein isoform X2 n=1 Tax=Littorina saxatilis TaxID=31220 RepID=UPI0038B4A8C2